MINREEADRILEQIGETRNDIVCKNHLLGEQVAQFKALFKGYQGPISVKDFVGYKGWTENGPQSESLGNLEKQVSENRGNEVLVIRKVCKPHSTYISAMNDSEDEKKVLSGYRPNFLETFFGVQYGRVSGEMQIMFPSMEIVVPTSGRHAYTRGKSFLGVSFKDPAIEFIGKDISHNYLDLPHLMLVDPWSALQLLKDHLDVSRFEQKTFSEIWFGENVAMRFSGIAGGKECYEKMKAILE